jgi:hypothetical protein
MQVSMVQCVDAADLSSALIQEVRTGDCMMPQTTPIAA